MIRPTRLQGDLIVLGSIPPLDPSVEIPPPPGGFVLPRNTFAARYAFSQALSRSTSLSVLETALDRYLSSTAVLPETLSSTGKPGLSRTQLIRKLGELLKFRQGLNLNRENFADIPDFYWAEPILEGELELEYVQRMLKFLQDTLNLLAKHWKSKHAPLLLTRKSHTPLR